MVFSSTTDIAIITLLCLVYLLSVKISTRTRLPPNTPPEVPYLIPWLGHGISFALRREDLMKKSRARFGPVYNLLVAGRVITVVSSPELMADLVGRSPKQVRAPEEDLLQATSGLKSRLPYVTMVLRRSIYGIIARRLTKHTMGPVTVPMNQKLFSSLNNLANQDGIAVFHLDELVQQSMYRASVSVLFGSSLPDTYSHFRQVDQWMYYGVNRIPVLGHILQLMHHRWAAAIFPYVQSHWEGSGGTGYFDGASTFMSECMQELKSAGLRVEETTCIVVAVLWGFHAQGVRVATNAIAFLVANPTYCTQLTEKIRNTIDQGWPDFETFLIAEPKALDSPGFDRIQSIVNETLRLSSLATVFRIPTVDIELADGEHRYVVQKGNYIAGDAYGLHHDGALYPNPEEFDGDRFLGKPTNYQARGVKTFVPWGGGTFICKGREFGDYAVKMMIIQLLYLYDISGSSKTGAGSLKPNRSLSISRLQSVPLLQLSKGRLGRDSGLLD